MFVSADDLKLTYGVDMRIGKRYVDRPVPGGNAYWEGRHLYIPPYPGYLFMPIYADLCHRCGMPLEGLLSEPVLLLSERILDSAARQESGAIDWERHWRDCHGFSGEASASGFLSDQLYMHFSGRSDGCTLRLGAAFPALGRADTYLFTLCALEAAPGLLQRAVDCWYALMAYFLLMDDLADIRGDLAGGEQNAVLEARGAGDAVRVLRGLIDGSHDLLSGVNPVLANRIDHHRGRIDLEGIINGLSGGAGAG